MPAPFWRTIYWRFFPISLLSVLLLLNFSAFAFAALASDGVPDFSSVTYVGQLGSRDARSFNFPTPNQLGNGQATIGTLLGGTMPDTSAHFWAISPYAGGKLIISVTHPSIATVKVFATRFRGPFYSDMATSLVLPLPTRYDYVSISGSNTQILSIDSTNYNTTYYIGVYSNIPTTFSLSTQFSCGPAGYNSPVGSTSCVACPTNTQTYTFASSTAADCRCMSGYYYDPSSTSCKQCQWGQNCVNGDFSIAPGYWKSTVLSNRIVQCPSPDACSKGECNPGYSGYACGGCASGYFRSNSLCQSCGGSGAAYIGVAGVALFAIWLGFFWFSSFFKYIGSLSIIITFVQLTALFGRVNLGWPAAMDTFFNVMSGFNLNMELMRPECTFSWFGWYAKWATILLMPVFFVAMYLLAWLLSFGIWLCARKHGWKMLRLKDCVDHFIAFMMFAYVPLVAASISAFNCRRTNDGTDVLAESPDIDCNSSFHSNVKMMAVIPLSVYTLGFPVIVAIVAGLKKRSMNLKWLATNFGCLYMKYRDKHVFWELAVMLRKVLMVCCIILLINYPLSQACTLLFVLGVSALLQLVRRPFRQTSSNALESISLTAQYAMILTGLLFFFNEGLSTPDGRYIGTDPSTTGLYVIIMFASFFGLMFCVLLFEIIRYWKYFKQNGMEDMPVMGRKPGVMSPRNAALMGASLKSPSSSASAKKTANTPLAGKEGEKLNSNSNSAAVNTPDSAVVTKDQEMSLITKGERETKRGNGAGRRAAAATAGRRGITPGRSSSRRTTRMHDEDEFSDSVNPSSDSFSSDFNEESDESDGSGVSEDLFSRDNDGSDWSDNSQRPPPRSRQQASAHRRHRGGSDDDEEDDGQLSFISNGSYTGSDSRGSRSRRESDSEYDDDDDDEDGSYTSDGSRTSSGSSSGSDRESASLVSQARSTGSNRQQQQIRQRAVEHRRPQQQQQPRPRMSEPSSEWSDSTPDMRNNHRQLSRVELEEEDDSSAPDSPFVQGGWNRSQLSPHPKSGSK